MRGLLPLGSRWSSRRRIGQNLRRRRQGRRRPHDAKWCGGGPRSRRRCGLDRSAQNVLPGLAARCAPRAALAMLRPGLACDGGSPGCGQYGWPGSIRTDAEGFATGSGRPQVARYPHRRLLEAEALARPSGSCLVGPRPARGPSSLRKPRRLGPSRPPPARSACAPRATQRNCASPRPRSSASRTWVASTCSRKPSPTRRGRSSVSTPTGSCQMAVASRPATRASSTTPRTPRAGRCSGRGRSRSPRTCGSSAACATPTTRRIPTSMAT